jgi:hypothetical protein
MIEGDGEKKDPISQIRYPRLNSSMRGQDRTNGEMAETGGEATTRRIAQVNDKKGQNSSSWIRRRRTVYGESKSGALSVR